jgi:hypothetical protein
LRYGWLTKAVRLVADRPDGFAHDDAMVQLGVGKNMVRSIRHWALAVGVLEEDSTVAKNRGRFLRVSALGEKLLAADGLDPFLERSATLWLLHYRMVSRSDGPTTWYWTFNHLPRLEFTAEHLVEELVRVACDRGLKGAAEGTIRRDVNCFIRTYVPARQSRDQAIEETLDCPFAELNLLHEVDGEAAIAFSRGFHETLPDWVFAYAVLDFWDRNAPQSTTLQFTEIAYHAGSPGRVFKLSESAVSARLQRIAATTRDAVTFDTTAGLSQLYRHAVIDPITIVNDQRRVARR